MKSCFVERSGFVISTSIKMAQENVVNAFDRIAESVPTLWFKVDQGTLRDELNKFLKDWISKIRRTSMERLPETRKREGAERSLNLFEKK